MKQFYTYLHSKPDTTNVFGIFYVGKGHGNRCFDLQRKHNLHHSNIVNKYGTPHILVNKIECSSEEIALELEKGLIKCLRRMKVRLANRTDGGEGTSGYKFSEEQKFNVSYGGFLE